MMNQPTDIFKPVYRCSNCGVLIKPDATECENCPATFRAVDVIDPVRVIPEKIPEIVKYYDYTTRGVANRLITSVPNGCALVQDIGGIGDVVVDHYIQMGEKPSGNPLTWSAITKGMILFRIENYTPTTMLIHPIQMYDLLQMGEFIGVSERAFFILPESKWKKNIEGLIGMIGGMHVVVSSEMTTGYVVMFDDNHFPDVRSAGVLLTGGRTELYE